MGGAEGRGVGKGGGGGDKRGDAGEGGGDNEGKGGAVGKEGKGEREVGGEGGKGVEWKQEIVKGSQGGGEWRSERSSEMADSRGYGEKN